MKKFVILAAILVNFGCIKVDEAFCAKGDDLLAISSKENVTDDDIATVKKS